MPPSNHKQGIIFLVVVLCLIGGYFGYQKLNNGDQDLASALSLLNSLQSRSLQDPSTQKNLERLEQIYTTSQTRQTKLTELRTAKEAKLEDYMTQLGLSDTQKQAIREAKSIRENFETHIGDLTATWPFNDPSHREQLIKQAKSIAIITHDLRLIDRYLTNYKRLKQTLCTTDDPNNDPYTKGTLTLTHSQQTKPDTCNTDNTKVIQHICEGVREAKDSPRETECEHGCGEGVCKRPATVGDDGQDEKVTGDDKVDEPKTCFDPSKIIDPQFQYWIRYTLAKMDPRVYKPQPGAIYYPWENYMKEWEQVTSSDLEKIVRLDVSEQLEVCSVAVNTSRCYRPPNFAPISDYRGLEQLCNLASLRIEDHKGTLSAVPPEIGQLGRLSTLQLTNNGLQGELPDFFDDLPALNTLSLWGNAFSGKIPPSLERMFHGQYLERYYVCTSEDESAFEDVPEYLREQIPCAANYVTFGIHPMWKAVILQKLSKDKWKDVSQDDLASIRELTIEGQLRWKGVDDSGLSLLSNLEELTFKSGPNITFKELFSLEKLHTFDFRGSRFWVDDQAPRSASLKEVRMYYQDHHIPEQTNQVFNQFFERMPNLEKLTAGFGNGFVFGEEEASSLANVKDLWFYTGPKYVNETFPAMPKLEKANFSSTSSTGNAPQYVENMKNLASLSIGRFTRSGIPEWVYELPEIRHLQVFGIRGGGLSENIGRLTKLETLYLAGDYYGREGLFGFSESIPESIGNLTHLTTLRLNRHHISQPLPQEINNLSNLTTLRVGESTFGGFFSKEFADSVESIDIQGPNGIFTTDSQTLADKFEAVRYTSPTPPDPSCQPDPSKIRDPQLREAIVMTLGKNTWGEVLPEDLAGITSLRASDRGISSMAGIGELCNLRELNLAKNSISGRIPTELGKLKELGSLYLSGNKLTGDIPEELTQTRLYRLSVCSKSGVETNTFTDVPGDLARSLRLDSWDCIKSLEGIEEWFVILDQTKIRFSNRRQQYLHLLAPNITVPGTEVPTDLIITGSIDSIEDLSNYTLRVKGKKHSKTSGTDFAFEVIPDSDLKVDFNPTTGDFRIEPLVFYDIGKIVELHVYLEDATGTGQDIAESRGPRYPRSAWLYFEPNK